MKGPTFMFVNKTAASDSLSHSNDHERIQIHSHVQRERRIRRSKANLHAPTMLRPLQPGRQPSTSDSSDGGTPTDHDAMFQRRPHPHIQPRQASGTVAYRPLRRATANDPVDADPSNHHVVVPFTIPIVPASAEANFDPFAVTCVKVDQAVHSLLQYFLIVHHPNIWHLERAVRKDHAYVFRYDALSVVQGCLHDEYNMYTLLASMASYMIGVDHMSPLGDLNYYIHKALKASQHQVQTLQPITPRMIFNTFHLGCAEWYRFNKDAAFVHLKAAKAMADALGGLCQLESPLVQLLLTGDVYVAAELQQKPLWTHVDLEFGENHAMTEYCLEELQKILSDEVDVARGLLNLHRQDIVPSNLRWIILDLAVVVSILRSASSGNAVHGALPPGGLHWIQFRTLSIRHQLLSLELGDPQSDAVRTAIVLWTFMVFTIAGRKRSAKVVAPFLRQTLRAIPDQDWDDQEELYLWILSVGALSAGVGTKEHRWFVSKIQTSSIMNPEGPSELSDLLVRIWQQFLYLESLQRAMLRNLAESLEPSKLDGKFVTSDTASGAYG